MQQNHCWINFRTLLHLINTFPGTTSSCFYTVLNVGHQVRVDLRTGCCIDVGISERLFRTLFVTPVRSPELSLLQPDMTVASQRMGGWGLKRCLRPEESDLPQEPAMQNWHLLLPTSLLCNLQHTVCQFFYITAQSWPHPSNHKWHKIDTY